LQFLEFCASFGKVWTSLLLLLNQMKHCDNFHQV
jgi:hypothetical protein